jgi:hypothetical protein
MKRAAVLAALWFVTGGAGLTPAQMFTAPSATPEPAAVPTEPRSNQPHARHQPGTFPQKYPSEAR